MVQCRTKRFKKTKICAGDLRHKISILHRQLDTPTPGTTATQLSFLLVKKKNAGLEVVSPSQKFEGVNIEDRPTHEFTVRKDNQILNIEYNNHFIEFRRRYFRVQKVSELEEDNRYLVFRTTERGDKEQAANEG